MNSVASIQFEWVYTPENYFRGTLIIPCEGGNILIKNGIVKAEIDPKALNVDESTAKKLDSQVENLFHDEQVKSQKRYELSMPFKVIIKKDGSRTVTFA